MALMNRMRENTKVILLILVFAFMLTIIIDWGMGGFKSGQKPGVIAEVNGDEIMYEQYKQMYDSELQSFRENRGQDPRAFELTQIESQVYESLVQQQLMTDVIDAFNLSATDAEITEEIWNNPPDIIRSQQAFVDSSGNFNVAQYQAALNNPDPQVSQFWLGVEQYLRSAIPMQKLNMLLTSSIHITDDDARIEFMKNNTKAKIKYLFFNSNQMASTEEPSESEIKAYYNAHKDDYNQVEKRVLDYVLFETKPTKADSEATMKQAQDILEEAKSSGNFEQLASLYSQDEGSAENGGDLGYFNKNAMVKPFSDAAFAAKPGDIVGPVESRFGIHIIKVEDKKREDGELKVKAKHILLKIETSPTTRNNLLDNAEYLADEEISSEEFYDRAKSDSLTVQTTQPFEKGGFIPGIGMESRVNNFAYRSKKGDLSRVISVDQGYLVAVLKDVIEEHVQPLEDVQDRIVNSLKSEKKMELAKAQAQQAYDKIAAGSSMEDVAAKDSLTVQETDEFSMTGVIPKVGKEPELAGKAFSIKVGDYSEPVKGTRGYYVIQLLDKKDFDSAEFEKQKEDLKLQLMVRAKQRIYSKWYADLKDKANIKDYRELYF